MLRRPWLLMTGAGCSYSLAPCVLVEDVVSYIATWVAPSHHTWGRHWVHVLVDNNSYEMLQ